MYQQEHKDYKKFTGEGLLKVVANEDRFTATKKRFCPDTGAEIESQVMVQL